MSPAAGDPLTVAVVDDHPIFRDGVGAMVSAHDGMTLVAAVGRVEDLLADRPVDVVVLDLGLPGCSGADAVAVVRDRGSGVLVLSADGTHDQVVEAVEAGAAGYLTKSSGPDEILAAIEVVGRGGTYVSASLAAHLIRASRGDGGKAVAVVMTAREEEILALVAAGERDVDIAEQLFISIRTVHSHLDRIRNKTGRRRRPDLTRLAAERGLLTPEE